MRGLKKYIHVRLIRRGKCEERLSPSDLFHNVRRLFKQLFGKTSLAQSFLRVKELEADKFVVSVNQAYLKEAIGVLSLIYEMNGQRVSIKVIKVSDTIKGSTN